LFDKSCLPVDRLIGSWILLWRMLLLLLLQSGNGQREEKKYDDV
jgi:hypothetical protein